VSCLVVVVEALRAVKDNRPMSVFGKDCSGYTVKMNFWDQPDKESFLLTAQVILLFV
jgi:hypothetical protein